MANKMSSVAALLGVKSGEHFKITDDTLQRYDKEKK